MSTRPSIENLRQLIRYDALSGKLFWLPRDISCFKQSGQCASWNRRFSGKEAFTTRNPDGYLMGMLFNQKYCAHQIVWALVRGEWSSASLQIDHKNRVKTDNRIENLHLVSPKQNIANRVDFSYQAGNERGIAFHKANGKWQVCVPVGQGKSRYIGCFEDIRDARIARDAAEKAIRLVREIAA